MTEVVEAVARSLGIPPERRADVFRAAQQVCAEELRLARTGFTPAPLSELAERAVRLLPSDLGGDRIALGGWTEDAPFPEEPLDEAAAGGPSGEPFPDEADVFAAAGEPMVERRLAEPSAVVSEAAAREGPVAARADDEEEEAPEEIEFEIVDRREPRGGKLAVFLLVVAIAGGIWFFAKTRRVPPASPSAAEPDAAGSTEAPAGAPASAIDRSVPAATTPSMAAVPTNAAPAAPPPPAIPESHGSTMLSPDWPGAPVWMIHFSSYQRKENAERDAARLAKIVGGPLHVIGVNLGATQGLWFRVMMGEYRTREEARAARDALAAKGTPGLGFVYRVEGLAPSKVEGLPPASKAEPPEATRAPAL